jgi:6,7-dimethyl-8-ribityllumazine synthase
MKIGIVVAEFNRDVTSKLEEGALAFLKEKGVKSKEIELIHVPGAFEIPLIAKALLKIKKVDAVIALGAVIRGDTTHYDYVCQAVERGCTMLQLEFVKPVVFGVLTTENEEQAFDRVGGSHGHKGRDAAETALRMIETLKNLKKSK